MSSPPLHAVNSSTEGNATNEQQQIDNTPASLEKKQTTSTPLSPNKNPTENITYRKKCEKNQYNYF